MFYVVSIACLMPWAHQKYREKETGKDENRPLGSAISFSNHYAIGILKKLLEDGGLGISRMPNAKLFGRRCFPSCQRKKVEKRRH